MTDRPILFSGPMVRALLERRKSQTRRVLKPQPLQYTQARGTDNEHQRVSIEGRGCGWDGPLKALDDDDAFIFYACIGYAPGDLLYVREAWHAEAGYDSDPPREIPFDACCTLYTADGRWSDYDFMNGAGRARAGMHMPRWASRLTLRVTEVRVQRLQEISEEDAQAEGADFDSEPCDHARRTCAEIGCAGPGYRGGFAELWQSLNAERGFGWDVNPWVVAVSFDVIPENIDAVKAREHSHA